MMSLSQRFLGTGQSPQASSAVPLRLSAPGCKALQSSFQSSPDGSPGQLPSVRLAVVPGRPFAAVSLDSKWSAAKPTWARSFPEGDAELFPVCSLDIVQCCDESWWLVLVDERDHLEDDD